MFDLKKKDFQIFRIAEFCDFLFIFAIGKITFFFLLNKDFFALNPRQLGELVQDFTWRKTSFSNFQFFHVRRFPIHSRYRQNNFFFLPNKVFFALFGELRSRARAMDLPCVTGVRVYVCGLLKSDWMSWSPSQLENNNSGRRRPKLRPFSSFLRRPAGTAPKTFFGLTPLHFTSNSDSNRRIHSNRITILNDVSINNNIWIDQWIECWKDRDKHFGGDGVWRL